MGVVVDASALLAVVLGEPERAGIIEATEGATLLAPSALPLKVGNALVAMFRRGRLSEDEVSLVWEATLEIPIRLLAVDVGASVDLALHHGIYAYDAYYIHCSLVNQRPLLTLDQTMRAIAQRLGIRLLV